MDAEKQVNRGGSASGNPMLATPNPEPNSSKQTNPQSRISTVLFVEQTRRGGLAAKMRETISRLEPMLGFRWKVVENAGTNLASLLVTIMSAVNMEIESKLVNTVDTALQMMTVDTGVNNNQLELVVPIKCEQSDHMPTLGIFS